MPAMDIFRLAANFLESCANVQGKLTLYKLLLIHHLSTLQVFRVPESNVAFFSPRRLTGLRPTGAVLNM